jgi:hypothetical protein
LKIANVADVLYASKLRGNFPVELVVCLIGRAA